MNTELQINLIEKAKENMSKENDPSHDILHTLRVLSNAENIAEKEGADLDVVIPAALFHDLIVHPKNSEKAKDSTVDSAELAEKILLNVDDYPKEKIQKVKDVILSASFIHGIENNTLEAKVVKDADLLEATGLVGAMRTFGSCGSMNKPFYHAEDPFGENREYDDMTYGLDHFYKRLLIAKDRMYSDSAKIIAERRTVVLHEFITELKTELDGK